MMLGGIIEVCTKVIFRLDLSAGLHAGFRSACGQYSKFCQSAGLNMAQVLFSISVLTSTPVGANRPHAPWPFSAEYVEGKGAQRHGEAREAQALTLAFWLASGFSNQAGWLASIQTLIFAWCVWILASGLRLRTTSVATLALLMPTGCLRKISCRFKMPVKMFPDQFAHTARLFLSGTVRSPFRSSTPRDRSI